METKDKIFKSTTVAGYEVLMPLIIKTSPIMRYGRACHKKNIKLIVVIGLDLPRADMNIYSVTKIAIIKIQMPIIIIFFFCIYLPAMEYNNCRHSPGLLCTHYPHPLTQHNNKSPHNPDTHFYNMRLQAKSSPYHRHLLQDYR